MSAAHFETLLARLVSVSPPGSRLCWRHLAAQWPTPVLPRLEPDEELARAVEAVDTSVFYRIGFANVV